MKNNNNITTANSSNNGTPAGTPRSSHLPQLPTSNRLFSLFRTFPSWPPTFGSTTATTTNTNTSLSLWSRLKSPSQSTLSKRENNNLRKLKEEAKRDKTERLQSSVSSPSLTAKGASSLDLAELMNRGGGIPSMRLAPVNQRVYVVEEV